MGREGGRGSGAGALKTTLHRPIFTLTTHRSSKTNQMVYLLPTDLIEEHIPFSAGKCLRNVIFNPNKPIPSLWSAAYTCPSQPPHFCLCQQSLSNTRGFHTGQLGRAGSTYSHSKPTISTRHSGLNKCLQKKDGRLEGTESMPVIMWLPFHTSFLLEIALRWRNDFWN